MIPFWCLQKMKQLIVFLIVAILIATPLAMPSDDIEGAPAKRSIINAPCIGECKVKDSSGQCKTDLKCVLEKNRKGSK